MITLKRLIDLVTSNILTIYITTLPVIIAGILNMVFTKTKIYKKLTFPIDFNIRLPDGKRLFGSHKTWIGMFSMICLCAIVQVIWGLACRHVNIDVNQASIHDNWTIKSDVMIGCLYGLFYMLFELPNSFVKRRLDIADGGVEHQDGWRRVVFTLIDQFDSMFGIALIPVICSSCSFLDYIQYVLVGGITHLVINLCLKALKLRRTI